MRARKTSAPQALLARLTPSGELDATFGGTQPPPVLGTDKIVIPGCDAR